MLVCTHAHTCTHTRTHGGHLGCAWAPGRAARASYFGRRPPCPAPRPPLTRPTELRRHDDWFDFILLCALIILFKYLICVLSLATTFLAKLFIIFMKSKLCQRNMSINYELQLLSSLDYFELQLIIVYNILCSLAEW